MASGGDLLARRYVEFASRGVPRVIAESNQISKNLKAQLSDYNKLQQAIKRLKESRDQARINMMAEKAMMTRGERIQDVAGRMDQFAGKAAMGFGILTGATMGWVSAGMSGTVEAYQLQQGFSYLSREIANIFAPTIRSVITWLRDATEWFRNLSEEEQSNIRKTVLWVAGILAGVLAINLLVKVFMLARAAALGFYAALGPIGISIAAVGVALVGLGSVWDKIKGDMDFSKFGGMFDSNRLAAGRAKQDEMLDSFRKGKLGDKLKEMNKKPEDDEAKQKKERERLALNQTGFEAIGSAWDRMANEVLKQEPIQKMSSDVSAIKEIMEQMASGGVSVINMLDKKKEMHF